ncbi:MAG: carboxypeptidase regulatory-like domain-containing protein [Gemmatimonadota bacterium]|nr:carboxypeptidase regulatory-like domain-containing protein [Gemmatimonadota bacterium]
MLPARGLAQAGSISGSVVDSRNGQPIPAVQLSLREISRNTLTGETGSFTLTDLPEGSYTIIIRHPGYQEFTQTGIIVRASGTASVTLRMESSAFALQEIVSTGLIDPTEGLLSPITIARVPFEEMPVMSNPLQSLQGRVAGVQMTRQSGEPGSGVTIMLRTPTIGSNSPPLIVVDGVILGDANAAQDIPQEDIASMEILRGAAAASIYGSQAGSGVISITTKRGLSLPQGTTRFSMRSEIGRSKALLQDDPASHHAFRITADGRSYADSSGDPVPGSEREFESFNPSLLFMDNKYPDPIYNNLEAVSQSGLSQTHNFSVSQNRLNTNFAVSLSRQREEGTVRGNDGYRRNAARLNLDHRFMETMSLGVSMSHATNERQRLFPADFWGDVRLTPRDVNLLTRDPGGQFTWAQFPQSDYENPLWMQEAYRDKGDAMQSLLGANYSWSPAPWLTASGVLGFDRRESDRWTFTPAAPLDPDIHPGEATNTGMLSRGYNAEAQLSLRRNFGPLGARAAFRTSGERFFIRSISRIVPASGISDASQLAETGTLWMEEDETRSIGYLFDLGLDYRGRFAVNLLGRRDGISLPGSESRWQNYYRAAGAWRMSEEEWFNLPHVSEFKLSLARGTVGSVPERIRRDGLLQFGTEGLPALPPYLNPDLRPSHTTETEASLNAIIFERFGLTLTHAWQRTTDQIISVLFPSFMGYYTGITNAGAVVGHTTEFTVEGRIIQSPRIGWNSTIIADRSRSTIDEWFVPCDVLYRRSCAGEPTYGVYGYRTLKSVGDLATHLGGSVVAENRTNEFQVNDEGLLVWVGTGHNWDEGMVNGRVVPGTWGTVGAIGGRVYDWGIPIFEEEGFGAAVPHLLGQSLATNIGWIHDVRYGGFNFSAHLHSAFGFVVNNQAARSMTSGPAVSWNYGKMDQFGKPDRLKKPVGYYREVAGAGISDYTVERGDYIKFRSASVSYTLDQSQLARLGLGRLGAEGLQLGVTGRNLFTITGYSGGDPEQAVNLNTRENAAGISDYPLSRNWTMNATLTF